MKKATILMITILTLGCNGGNKQATSSKDFILKDIELVSYKAAIDIPRVGLFYPMIEMKWKNISNRGLEDDIILEVVFIDNVKKEELGRGFDTLQMDSEAPFLPGISKNITLKCSEKFIYYGRDLSGMLESLDYSCHIYLNGVFYKEVKVEGIF